MSENQEIHPAHQGDDAGNAANHEHSIRERAFFLWQEAGSPEGREEEFWHQARAHHAAADSKQEVEQHNPNASQSAASGEAKTSASFL